MNKTKKWLTRRQLQKILAVLWIVDGLFQLQPKMFTKSFVNLVINPSIQSQPKIIADPMHFFGHIFLLNPIFFNSSFFLIQVLIGILIWNNKTAKQGLYLSIVWGLFVWYVGEGLGGVFAGQANLIMGAPGAAILYVILALAIIRSGKSRINSSDFPDYWLVFVWLLIWVGFGIIQLLAKSDSLNNIRLMIASNANGAPSYIRSIDLHASAILASFVRTSGGHVLTNSSMMSMTRQVRGSLTNRGYWFIVVLSFVQVLVGLGVLAKHRLRHIAVYVGIVVALIFWVVGQNFGQYYSGFATDLNTAPLIIVLGLAIINNMDINKQLTKILSSLEEFLT